MKIFENYSQIYPESFTMFSEEELENYFNISNACMRYNIHLASATEKIASNLLYEKMLLQEKLYNEMTGVANLSAEDITFFAKLHDNGLAFSMKEAEHLSDEKIIRALSAMKANSGITPYAKIRVEAFEIEAKKRGLGQPTI